MLMFLRAYVDISYRYPSLAALKRSSVQVLKFIQGGMSMSTASNVTGQCAASTAAYEAQKAEQRTEKKTRVYGQTIGKPQLSEKAQKYYEELKKKYGDMDFILVSSDMKEVAKAQAGKYGKPNRTVVLIDEEKIERMAEDESYRKQYEGILSNARNKISQMKQTLQKTGAKVKSFGIQVHDNGTATLFATLEKGREAQKTNMEKRAARKAAQRKADKRAEKKEKAEEALASRRDKNRADDVEDEDTITFSADSMEELLRKVSDYMFMQRSDMVQTEEEKKVGQSFDFRG